MKRKAMVLLIFQLYSVEHLMEMLFKLRCSRTMPTDSVSERLNFPNNSQILIRLAPILNSLSILLLPTAVEPRETTQDIHHARLMSKPVMPFPPRIFDVISGWQPKEINAI